MKRFCHLNQYRLAVNESKVASKQSSVCAAGKSLAEEKAVKGWATVQKFMRQSRKEKEGCKHESYSPVNVRKKACTKMLNKLELSIEFWHFFLYFYGGCST